jgi:hypothetical protein
MKKDKKYKLWGIALVLTLSWCVLVGGIAQHNYLDQARTLIAQQRFITELRADDLADSVQRNLHYLSGIPNMLSHLRRVNRATVRFGPHAAAFTAPYEQRKSNWTKDPALNDLSLYLAVVRYYRGE